VIAVLGGLGAACSWAGALLCASRATKLIGPPSVLTWVMLTGLVVVAPVAAAGGIPDELGRRELGWLLVAGAGNVAGLLFSYAALRVGKVSIVGPISSTEGAIAAVLAIVAGEAIGSGVAGTLCVIVAGVVLAGIAPDGEAGGDPLRASLLAVGAAVCFGVSLYATARVSEALPLIWAVLPARVLGVAVVALPLLAMRRIRITRRALPLVVASGLCEVGGFASFALGSRHGIAVAAVLASQFAAVAAVAAYVLFHERLTRLQLTGVVAIAVGVAVLTGLQA
jgi:drug/metabolite transporter (DMT)-like permease